MHFLLRKKKYQVWYCQNVCDALTFLLANTFIRFGTKVYRQVVGIHMGTNCAPMVADLFCYERDLMMSLLMISRLILLTILTLHLLKGQTPIALLASS